MKYFVLGAFSSAFLLYGIALIYGATGSTNFIRIKNSSHLPAPSVTRATCPARRAAARRPGAAAGRASASRWPRCRSTSWTPDVYEGRPPRRSPSWPARSRRRPSPRFVRVFVLTFPNYGSTGARSSGCWPCCRLLVGAVAGHRPDQRQADAGLLVDQPRRVHPGGRRGGQRGRALRPCSSTWSPTPSWWPGRFARGRRGRPGGATAARPSRTTRACPRSNPLLAGVLTVFLLAQAGDPVHGRLLRQVPGRRLGAATTTTTGWPSWPCCRAPSPPSSTCASSCSCTWATRTRRRPSPTSGCRWAPRWRISLVPAGHHRRRDRARTLRRTRDHGVPYLVEPPAPTAAPAGK